MNSLPVPSKSVESANSRLLSLGSLLVVGSLALAAQFYRHGDVVGALSMLLVVAAGVLFLGIGFSPNAD